MANWRDVFEAKPTGVDVRSDLSKDKLLGPSSAPEPPEIVPRLEKIPEQRFLDFYGGDFSPAYTKITFDDPPDWMQDGILEPLVHFFKVSQIWGLNPSGVKFEDFRILWVLFENKIQPGQHGGREQTSGSYKELHVAFQHKLTGQISLHDTYWVTRSPGPTGQTMLNNSVPHKRSGEE